MPLNSSHCVSSSCWCNVLAKTQCFYLACSIRTRHSNSFQAVGMRKYRRYMYLRYISGFGLLSPVRAWTLMVLLFNCGPKFQLQALKVQIWVTESMTWVKNSAVWGKVEVTSSWNNPYSCLGSTVFSLFLLFLFLCVLSSLVNVLILTVLGMKNVSDQWLKAELTRIFLVTMFLLNNLQCSC